MPRDDYFIAPDADALRMESELVGLENSFLKGRIANLEEELRKAREAEARARRELERLKNQS